MFLEVLAAARGPTSGPDTRPPTTKSSAPTPSARFWISLAGLPFSRWAAATFPPVPSIRSTSASNTSWLRPFLGAVGFDVGGVELRAGAPGDLHRLLGGQGRVGGAVGGQKHPAREPPLVEPLLVEPGGPPPHHQDRAESLAHAGGGDARARTVAERTHAPLPDHHESHVLVPGVLLDDLVARALARLGIDLGHRPAPLLAACAFARLGASRSALVSLANRL